MPEKKEKGKMEDIMQFSLKKRDGDYFIRAKFSGDGIDELLDSIGKGMAATAQSSRFRMPECYGHYNEEGVCLEHGSVDECMMHESCSSYAQCVAASKEK